MTAIESLPAFLAGYARGAATNSLAATPQPGDTVLRDEADWRMLRDEMHGEKL